MSLATIVAFLLAGASAAADDLLASVSFCIMGLLLNTLEGDD